MPTPFAALWNMEQAISATPLASSSAKSRERTSSGSMS